MKEGVVGGVRVGLVRGVGAMEGQAKGGWAMVGQERVGRVMEGWVKEEQVRAGVREVAGQGAAVVDWGEVATQWPGCGSLQQQWRSRPA